MKIMYSAVLILLMLADAVQDSSDPDDGSIITDDNAIDKGQFLIISSPQEHKVVWSGLRNFESADGRAFALVDTGLDTPKGLAFDHKQGFLYIADVGAKKIFRYTVLTDTSGDRPTLTTTGVRLTIVEGLAVEWVAIDHEGSLFYTAPDTNNINKISREVLKKITTGEYTARSLQIVDQKTLQAQQKAEDTLARKEASDNADALPTDAPAVQPHILSIYDASINTHVARPAAITAMGQNLYWTNAKDGLTAGTIVKGSIHPDTLERNVSETSKPFPAEVLTSVSDGAFGLSLSEKVMFFTRDNPKYGNKSGLISGLLMGTDIVLDFSTDLVKPRGLVWDQDQTVYVADNDGGSVWSFPAGRMMPHVPLTEAVKMSGAYGLVLLSDHDPCFTKNSVTSDGDASAFEDAANNLAQAGNGREAHGSVSLMSNLRGGHSMKDDARTGSSPIALVMALTAIVATMFEISV